MNLAKSIEFFNPTKVKERVHIIGCGASGSTVAELLARAGLEKVTLYDFDKVESHNIANQMFKDGDIGRNKAEAVKDMMLSINPDANGIEVVQDGYTNQRLSGYVFLMVDNIDLRRKICEDNARNPYIKAVFDTRLRLTDAQHFAADWSSSAMVENLINSMQFTQEEALAETPRSACNLELSIAPSVRMICCCAVANFMNFVNGRSIKKVVLIDAFDFTMEAY
nr:MAG TPA: E1 enzyme family protein [Caudoviricetes sp.]